MNNKMKWCSAILAASMLTGGLGWMEKGGTEGSVQAASASQKASLTDVTIKWNGKALSQKGKIRNGVTYIPAAALRDGLGIPLQYDADAKTYTLGKGYNVINAAVYGTQNVGIGVNGFYGGDTQGFIADGRLYIPYGTVNEYLGIQGQWNGKLKTLSLSAKKQNKITISSKTIQKPTDKVDIKIRYPIISGLADQEAEAAVNTALKKHAEEFVAASEKQLKEFPMPEPDRPYEYVGDFVVHYNANDKLSITSYEYTYMGGAHGMTYRKSFNFSLKDGKQLKLGDVISLKGGNQSKLDRLMLEQMKKDGGYLGDFEGVPADTNFYMKDHSVVLYFQLYEYTAYAFGFPELELPLKTWK